ncbi:MAG: hypothetical protein AAFV38_14770 [Pseudomonadota bacterium]
MGRLVQADDDALIEAFETQLRKLQETKLLLAEKLENEEPEQGSFEEAYRTAIEFLANPHELWASDDPADRNLFLKLVFTDQIKYHQSGGYRTAPIACIFELLQGSNDNTFAMVRTQGEKLNQLLQWLETSSAIFDGRLPSYRE